MSRQRDYQIRMRAEGRCIKCGATAATSTSKRSADGKSPYCEDHMVQSREMARKRDNAKRRNTNCRSYKKEAE